MTTETKQIVTSLRPAAPAYVIESSIPLPASARKPKYPFAQMKEGDSFTFHKDEKSTCASAATTYGKANGLRFVVREQNGIMRCWHAGPREES